MPRFQGCRFSHCHYPGQRLAESSEVAARRSEGRGAREEERGRRSEGGDVKRERGKTKRLRHRNTGWKTPPPPPHWLQRGTQHKSLTWWHIRNNFNNINLTFSLSIIMSLHITEEEAPPTQRSHTEQPSRYRGWSILSWSSSELLLIHQSINQSSIKLLIHPSSYSSIHQVTHPSIKSSIHPSGCSCCSVCEHLSSDTIIKQLSPIWFVL